MDLEGTLFKNLKFHVEQFLHRLNEESVVR